VLAYLSRYTRRVTGAFAEFERSMIRQRIKAGRKRAVAQGTRIGRPKVDVSLPGAQGAEAT
jgi:DNA invertase Pin-like site-specific DNA recombinase